MINAPLSRDAGLLIRRREWLWLTVVIVVAGVISSVPYMLGFLSETNDLAFSGFIFGLGDMNSYIAKMRYGATNPGWLFEIVYTLEDHQLGIIFPFHLTLGKVAALLSGQGAAISTRTLVLFYHLARILCGSLLIIVLYHFICLFVPIIRLRRLALMLAVFSSGLGWVVLFSGIDGYIPVFFYIPEAFTWLHIYGLPHLALARSLLFLGWIILFYALERGSFGLPILSGLMWFLMGIIVPFYVALLGVLIAAWLGTQIVFFRSEFVKVLRVAIIAGILPVLILLYYGWLFTSDPILSTWSGQNQLQTPPVWHLLLTFGALMMLAVCGLLSVRHTRWQPRLALLVIWIPIAFILIYLPINVQRRLLEGVIVPLAILGAVGIDWLVGKLRFQRGRAWLLKYGILAFLTLPGLLLLMFGGTSIALSPRPPAFQPVEQTQAHHWLRQNAPTSSAVLSTFPSGNILPAGAPVRVYVGHGPETVDSEEKRPLADMFFRSPDAPTRQRAADAIDLSTIDYVWVGPDEQNPECDGTCLQPSDFGLIQVYSNALYTIYEVP